MFGLSFGELFIIGVVGLIVIGPERLPTVARTLGHLVGRAQRYVSDVKSDIQREMDIQEIAKIKDEMQSAVSDVKSSVEDTASALRNPVNALRDDLERTGQSVRDSVSGETATSQPDAVQVPAAAEAGSTPAEADPKPTVKPAEPDLPPAESVSQPTESAPKSAESASSLAGGPAAKPAETDRPASVPTRSDNHS
ncbi:preprotein translocase subunit TatA [Advenella kashmirensis W13003]|uniref:Sec-independent protein translocase protein TatB n=1 Tax=Advenella kashmirensis W13003 TaxID=1424334 RepID=V8QVR4_9BURK|nr:Sec-independent protein translocase protein TatB [Advenella kashmirensis]ETF03074.1 preprotein translocase subunit TatA [Advenella kashmirensis W13003]